MDNTRFNVTDYGISGDGVADNTEAIAKLVLMIERNGGGTLFFPAGKYVTGTIELKSNMTLYLENGAVILGSDDPKRYPMITNEDVRGYTRGGHSGLIKAIEAENVVITGHGTIDGRGYNWWSRPENEHRPRAIQFIKCTDVLIENVKIINSAMWTVHPICCQNVTINGITIKNPSDSPNTDGINPESCSGVHISNCTVDVGDDCVTLKSGTEEDILQKQYPCEDIVITNCTILNGHGGVVIGSEMSGGVRNVTISNCVFKGTDRGIRLKTRRKRGGVVSDVLINNIIMTDVFAPIVINGYYQCGGTEENDMSLFSLEPQPVTEMTPQIKNIYITNVLATKAAASAGYIYALPEMPVENLRISNYSVEMCDTEGEMKDKPIMAYHVPYTKGEGFYCANIADSLFRDVSIKVVRGAGIEIQNGKDVVLDGVSVSGTDEKYRVNNSTGIKVDGKYITEEND